MVTFVKATFVLVTFVHIGNILAVTDPIFTKRLGPDFLQALTSLIEIFLPKFSLAQIFGTLEIFFWTPIFAEQFFLDPKCLRHEHFLDSKLFWT